MRRPGMFAVLAVLYAVARLVEFEVGAVFTDCSLPILAAMVVALPPGLLPWGVAIGATLSAGIAAARGDRHVSRVVPAVAQASLPLLAPAAVLVALPPVGSWLDAPVIAVALAAYIAADLVIALVFERLAYAKPLALPSRGEAWVYAIDLLLAPVGIAIAIAANGRSWAVAIVFLPLALLMRVFATSAEPESTRHSNSRTPTGAPRCSSATWWSPTMPTPARTAATSSTSPSRSARA